jgi:ATP phosphoribosyltransferase regulatory subunit HisZ
MGFLDRVKELATDSLEKGQELAKGQQLKLEAKKLDAAVDDAFAAYGRKAFEHAEAGTLSADALATEAQAVRDAKTAADAKRAEIEALGDTDEEAAEPVAAGDGTSTSS